MFQLDAQAISRLVAPAEQCKKTTGGFFAAELHPQNRAQYIAQADAVLAEEIPLLPLSAYLLYSQTGNRTVYEGPYFRRRDMLLALLSGELADGRKGKYIKKIMDILWAVLEEETWVIPAHNATPLEIHAPFEFDEVHILDLFSAATGATVAVVYHYLRDAFEAVIPRYFNEKIERELHRRILRPFVSDYPLSWKGLTGWYVNNWNPWITSNALTVALLAVDDLSFRKTIVERACLYLNHYFSFTCTDGACIEGVNYYFAANAVLLDIADLFYDFTAGAYRMYDEPYLKQLLEYIVHMYAGNGLYFSVSDFGRNALNQKGELRFYKRAAQAVHSTRLQTLYDTIQTECTSDAALQFRGVHSHAYRFIRNLAESVEKNACQPQPLGDTYLESVQQMVLRGRHFTLFSKAANNHEPHGHNDSGEFLVYYKKRPLFVDPGVEAYAAATFGPNRDKIWTMRSAWHNTPILNGCEQQTGREGDFKGKYHTTDVNADLAGRTMSMQLKGVYPEDSGILSAVRTTRMQGDVITVTDDFAFAQQGEYTFNLVSVVRPEITEGRLIFRLGKDTILCDFNPACKAAVEERRLEDAQMRGIWNQDALYRVAITQYALSGSFTLRITEAQSNAE